MSGRPDWAATADQDALRAACEAVTERWVDDGRAAELEADGGPGLAYWDEVEREMRGADG